MSVRWKRKKNQKNNKNEYRNEMVLKGLEEQRLKALKEENGKEVKEMKSHKNIAGYVFDEEKKRYFPKSVLREVLTVFALKSE